MCLLNYETWEVNKTFFELQLRADEDHRVVVNGLCLYHDREGVQKKEMR